MKKLIILVVAVLAIASLKQYGDIADLAPPEHNRIFYIASGEVVVPAQQADTIRPQLDVIAEAVSFSGDKKTALTAINSLGGRLVHSQTLNDTLILYAYSPRLSGYQDLPFGRFNLMLALSNNTIIVASPIIYGAM